jgi:3-isopropylmalate/(R)-2-methylmalate dehydratase small subunit
MKFCGKAWKFGDHVDTDLIIPARFLNVSDKNLLAKNCFADLRPEFERSVEAGDILVAGVNFGCGSSREHAPWAIKAAGISLIIAKSFARIFYRNAFNIGLPILESEDAPDGLLEGETILVDLATGEIVAESRGTRFASRPIPEFMRQIVQAGGLVEYVKGKGTFRPANFRAQD